MPDFTLDQKKAIYTKDCDLLVAAAAGSGKTAVLVERILNLIFPEKGEPVPMDRLLVVTFTDAAATEMKERIEKAIYEKIELFPDDENLKKQLFLLPKASISTIHSFCKSVIKKYFYLTDLDPSVKVADSMEISLIQVQVFEELFESLYESEDNEIFKKLVNCYGGNKATDTNLKEMVLKLYEFIRNLPQGEVWLFEKISEYGLEDIENCLWFKSLVDNVKTEIESVYESILEAREICKKPMGPMGYLDALDDDLIMVEDLRSCKTFDELFKRFNEDFKHKNLGKIDKKSTDELLQEEVKEIRDKKVKEVIKKIKEKYFIYDLKTIKEMALEQHVLLEELAKITLLFSEQFKKIKKEKNIIDFSDLEHYCLQILSDEDENFVKSKAAQDLCEFYEHVMVDEYQDSNSLQERILSLVSRRDKKNRFMVGDIKQSIYKFRRANPEIFIEKYLSFKETGDQVRIDLSKNFRSSSLVIDFCNMLFEQIMTDKVGDIFYDEKAKLNCGASFPVPLENMNVANKIELIFGLEETKKETSSYEAEDETEEEKEDETGIQFEAKMIALKIKEMIEGENPIFVRDKATNEYRKAMYKDVVIISSALKDISYEFEKTFKKVGVPFFSPPVKGYFKNYEIDTFFKLLQVIDNPCQDLPLITVLSSPIFSLDEDELLEIRKINEKAFFYKCLMEYSKTSEKAKQIIDKISNWRKISLKMSITEFVSFLIYQTNFENIVSVMPLGAMRRANLNEFKNIAKSYENTSFKGFFNFIKYIEKVKKSDLEGENAKIISENEDAVRLMSIHKSKGLEFPIVILCRTNKQFRVDNAKEVLSLNQKLGLGLVYVDDNLQIKCESLPFNAITAQNNLESLSEEMRKLYVALTRAIDLLIITGVVKGEKKLNDLYKNATEEIKPLPISLTSKAKCFCDWLFPAMALKESVSLTIIEKQDIFYDEEEKIEAKINETLTHLDLDLEKELLWQYPFSNLVKTPTKISMTELKRAYQKETIDHYTNFDFYLEKQFEMPSFIKKGSVEKVRIGTIVHSIMEHIKIDIHNTKEEIEKLVNSLVATGLIKESEKQYVPIDKILNFVNSSTGEKMKRATKIFKEIPFVMGVKPEKILGKEYEYQESILVHGIIDCYFFWKDESGKEFLTLLDYKTDRITNEQQFVEKYKPQLLIYKDAIENSIQKSVDEILLYSFDKDKDIVITRRGIQNEKY